MIPSIGMEISKALVVRILGLGADGSRALPSVAGAVADLWSCAAEIEIESFCAGDDEHLAARSIRRWCDRDRVDVVVTVGRSGHERADFAPEITVELLDRVLPGIEERAPGSLDSSASTRWCSSSAGMPAGNRRMRPGSAAASER